MTLSTLVLVAAGIVAVVDWYAVERGLLTLERVAKPATMLLLVGVAATVGEASAGVRVALVIGALFGVVGDVALLDRGETAFMVGLGAFAVGHLAYAAGALLTGFDLVWAIPGLIFITGLLGFRFLTRTLPAARAHGGSVLAGAVLFYAFVISSMVVTAWATAAITAAIGAMLFAISDWVLGHNRFVGPVPGGRLMVMVPYHVGQTLLIIGVATAA